MLEIPSMYYVHGNVHCSLGCVDSYSQCSEIFTQPVLSVTPSYMQLLHYSLSLPIWECIIPTQQLAANIIDACLQLIEKFGDYC